MKSNVARNKTIAFFIILTVVFSVFALMDYQNKIVKAEEKLYEVVLNHEELQYLMVDDYSVENVSRDKEDSSVVSAKIKLEELEFLVSLKGDTVLDVAYILHCEKGGEKETCYSKLLYENKQNLEIVN